MKQTKKLTKKTLITSILFVVLAVIMAAGSIFAWFTVTRTPGTEGSNSNTSKEDEMQGTLDIFEELSDVKKTQMDLTAAPGSWRVYRLELVNRSVQSIKVMLRADQFRFSYPTSYTQSQIDAGPYYNRGTETLYANAVSPADFNNFVTPITNAYAYTGFSFSEGDDYNVKLAMAKRGLLDEVESGGTDNFLTKRIARGAAVPEFSLSQIEGFDDAQGYTLLPGTENKATFFMAFYFYPEFISYARLGGRYNVELRNSNPFFGQTCNFRMILRQIR